MKKIFISIMFIPTLLCAGHDQGGGGGAVVCKGTDGKITAAEMVDTFEGVNLYGLSYSAAQLTIEEWLLVAELKLKSNEVVFNDYQRIKKEVLSKIKYLNSIVALNPINDANFQLKLKDPACAYTWTASYTANAGVLIDKEIYDAFDTKSKAALLLHEVIYKLNREAGKSGGTSDRARMVVAYLLSESDDPIATQSLILKELRIGSDVKLEAGLYEPFDPANVECSFKVLESSYYHVVTQAVSNPKFESQYPKPNCDNPVLQRTVWQCDAHTNMCAPQIPAGVNLSIAKCRIDRRNNSDFAIICPPGPMIFIKMADLANMNFMVQYDYNHYSASAKYEAAGRLLIEEDLYYASTNISCSLTGKYSAVSPYKDDFMVSGPNLLTRAENDKFISKGKCLYYYKLVIEDELYKLLEASGYKYDGVKWQ